MDSQDAKTTRGQGTDEEVDVVGLDPCEQATNAIDEIARTASEQLRALTANTRRSTHRTIGKASTFELRPTMPPRHQAEPAIRINQMHQNLTRKIPATTTTSSNTPHTSVRNSESTLDMGHFQNTESISGPSHQNMTHQKGSRQHKRSEQLAAQELANRGYAVRALDALITQQDSVEIKFENLRGVQSAPGRFPPGKVRQEKSAAQNLANRGLAVHALAALEQFGRRMKQLPPRNNPYVEITITKAKAPVETATSRANATPWNTSTVDAAMYLTVSKPGIDSRVFLPKRLVWASSLYDISSSGPRNSIFRPAPAEGPEHPRR
ncbi:hypothetical protein QAD02_023749 [Eretmocerus hayati]|uniref:Uncharacterized protein n=1 Tax=Eretmocerus hayati TaxID=131215 RepID=A0ACC2PWH3_9HYME|nr:hypothetical protein QAD02_023749 [Eretmocerus hayati]